MKNKALLIISILIILPTMLFSQDIKKGRGGIHGSIVGNYIPFTLNVTDKIGSISQSYSLRSPDLFPDPEQYLEAYQFGFINTKKDWHDFRLSFIYMPETTKSYTEIKNSNSNWLSLGGADIVSKDMELYLINMSHVYKLNLMMHKLYLIVGFGGGGGVIRWPSHNSEGNDLYFLSYYGYPLGGVELKLFKRLSISGEYHYQYGQTNTQTVSVTGGNTTYKYNLEGHEVAVGINIYF